MDWASFWGALAGTVIAVLAIIGIILVWDYLDRRRTQSNQVQKQPPPPIKDFLESQLEQYVIEDFEYLFHGWKIFDEPTKNTKQPQENRKPLGVRYRIDAGEIDIGLSLVILNGAERSEESLKYSIASRRFRDFSLPAVAQNDIRAKVL